LAEKFACKPERSHSGRRMSGQKLSMKITTVPSLEVGSCRQANVPMALWNLDELFPKEQKYKGIEGFVSLNFFEKTAFTMDYQQKKMFIESPASLKQRLSAGFQVPVIVERKNGIETSISLPLSFSNGKTVLVEVDTGSGCLILNEEYMKLFGIAPDSPNLKKVAGKDETGHSYIRYFCQLPADISLKRAGNISQSKPNVMFQKIIHAGLVGDAFLRNFIVTYDLANNRMIFALPKNDG